MAHRPPLPCLPSLHRPLGPLRPLRRAVMLHLTTVTMVTPLRRAVPPTKKSPFLGLLASLLPPSPPRVVAGPCSWAGWLGPLFSVALGLPFLPAPRRFSGPSPPPCWALRQFLPTLSTGLRLPLILAVWVFFLPLCLLLGCRLDPLWLLWLLATAFPLLLHTPPCCVCSFAIRWDIATLFDLPPLRQSVFFVLWLLLAVVRPP